MREIAEIILKDVHKYCIGICPIMSYIAQTDFS